MIPVAATIALELSRTVWCASCDVVFSVQSCCPRCGSPHFFPLSAWLDRVKKK
jgi:RNA polymerase subunit RPABC4/transcription elongation factor Spt4